MGKMTAIGTRFENFVRDAFRDAGWVSERLPKRGIKGEPDVYATRSSGGLIQIQCKERVRLSVGETLIELQEALQHLDEYGIGDEVVVWKRMEKRGDTGRRTQVGDVMAIIPFSQYVDLQTFYAETRERNPL